MKFKDFVYNLSKYNFAQVKFLRKWYGGVWTKVRIQKGDVVVKAWIKGSTQDTPFNLSQVVAIEYWGKYNGKIK